MPSLQIQFRGLTPRTHALTIERDDQSSETAVLETRSLLLHDFVHLAIEEEAQLQHGFWGLVARGASPGDLRLDDTAHPDLITAETLVGPMQAVWHGRLSVSDYVALAARAHPSIDDGFVARVVERVRRLDGQWRSTRFGNTMTVVFRTRDT